MKLHALLAAGLLALASTASADLARVGPNDVPAPPGNGFPKWYQDLNGLVLDLCMPNASDPGALQQTACLLGPPNPPYVFPTNFPDEAFYFRAVSAPLVTDTATGKRAVLVLALEAAFANGAPAAGDQMVFTRIRVTAGVPHPGTYRVVHPYGTETFEVTAVSAGNRDIVFTEDVGITPGAFTQALSSRVGPFLTRADANGVPLGPVLIGGAQFLSDGVALEFVTGSPFGTNLFQICGPFNGPGTIDACIDTRQFTLTGRLHDTVAQPIGSPLTIERATYARDPATAARINVVASVVTGTAPLLSAGTPGLNPVRLRGPDVLGRYLGQGVLQSTGAPLPSLVTVINSSDTPPSTTTRHLVDEVDILSATYDAELRRLVVVATSSDKGNGTESAPILALEGFPGAAVVRPFDLGDPASVQFTVENLIVAPTEVGVVSSAGGQDRRLATIPSTDAFTPGVPLALDDAASATASGQPVTVNVLANDISGTAPRFNPGAVSLVAPGLTPSTLGTLLANADGTVSFTPNATTGTATFRYTVGNAVGPSNPATVTITVTPGAGGPVPLANNDPTTGAVAVVQGQSVVIDVLANDSGNGGTLDPASVAITTPPTRGSATVNRATGTVTYTAGTQPGPDSFQYTVKNSGPTANTSAPATVSINVTTPETINITRARCQGGARWDVRGTASTNSTSVTAYLTAAVPSLPQPTDILGTAPVDATGAFQIQVSGPACRTPISVRSSLGTVQNGVPVTLR